MNYSEQELSQLLGRDLMWVDLRPLARLFSGRPVMVTGAAGSIGTELCGQLLGLGLKTLVCLDRDETAMFELENHLSPGAAQVEFCVDDVSDSTRLRRVVRDHRVEIIFHAAAYKHVPLMERNPAAAVQNNVLALRRAMQIAEEEGVTDFLLISSDKAVNPASVMGCTKRIGELMCSGWAGEMRTKSVRFGNVLGSQGSVLPALREQLHRGGPLRVTHPEASRFFMTIGEAASLLLLAFSLGDAREILVLKIGEPLAIVRLAQRLAALMGAPEQNIVFTGLRPGEKLHEELFYASETQAPTDLGNIIRAHGARVNWQKLNSGIEQLEQCLSAGIDEDLYSVMASIVPEYGFAANDKSAEVEL